MLLVDDDAGDIALITEAFAAHQAPVQLHIAGDGVEASAFLRREGREDGNAAAPRPDPILLDLNMPRMDGREVLLVVTNDSDPRTIPVVVFTTSEQPDDITSSYIHHANAYVTQPLDPDELDRTVSLIDDFYGRLVTAPRLAA